MKLFRWVAGPALVLLVSHTAQISDSQSNYNKHIPRKIWVAVKDRSDEVPGHLKDFFLRNPLWQVNICDNSCKDQFMNATFYGTDILWAYQVINPVVGAARADIWRYAVLYTHGGLYIDDDSDIKTPLDEIVSPTDRLIMSEEGASSLGDCYLPSYHLSETAIINKYGTNYTHTSPYYHNQIDPNTNFPIYFHGNTLINWALFICPQHPLMWKLLQNIIEILRSEYYHRSVVMITRWDVKWKYVMCSTGFTLTYTLRELLLEGSISPFYLPRISTNNFHEYHGRVKAIWTGGDPNHYMKAMQRKNGPQLLKDFAPFELKSFLEYLDGRPVMGDAGKEVYLIRNGMKCSFQNYEIFLQMKFSSQLTKHIPDSILTLIPNGPLVTSNDLIQDKKETRVVDKSRMVSNHLTNSVVLDLLKKVVERINNQSVICFGDDYAGSRDDYLNDKWLPLIDSILQSPSNTSSSFHSTGGNSGATAATATNTQVMRAGDLIGHLPVFVYPFCMKTFQLGNTLGYYLNDLACAAVSGSHFIAVHKNFNILHPHLLHTTGNAQFEFFNHLPEIWINPHAVYSQDVVKTKMKKDCHCLQYCWENKQAPWIKMIPLIHQVLLPAIDAYTTIAHAYEIGTVLDNTTDYVSHHPFYNQSVSSRNSHPGQLIRQTFYPLIPNVTIQYRCGDNIGFGKTRYGLLPFATYRPPRIPSDEDYYHTNSGGSGRYIYVIADSPQRQSYHAYTARCDVILEHLFHYLQRLYPRSIVLIKRGGDPFLDYARIVYSQIVVCSASTFCLWPALANNVGQVHFPLTPLAAGAWTNETALNLKNNFHWIRELEMIKEFKKYRPWTNLLIDLESA